ncbi:family 43 glycosylhydrolase [Poriferisphaera corsica]|nr:family 43 glycosylhydrolase [Poriferisphaera corsica]
MRKYFIAFVLSLSGVGIVQGKSTDTLAYWRFEDGKPLTNLNNEPNAQPATGQTVSDVTGNNNRLRTFNTDVRRYPPDTSPTFSQRVGAIKLQKNISNNQSMHFTGMQDLYTFGGPLEKTKLKAFTLEVAVRIQSIGVTNDEFQVIVGKDGQPVKKMGNAPLQLTIAGRTEEDTVKHAPAIQIFDREGNFHNAASQTPLPKDAWVWLAAVCDGETLKLFVDRGKGYRMEANVDGIKGGLIESKGGWTIGRGMFRLAPGQWVQQGWIDEVRITSRALNVREFVGYKRSKQERDLDESQAERMSSDIEIRELVKDIADPCMIKAGDTFYISGTGAPNGFDAYSSKDLKNWKKHTGIFKKTKDSWGTHWFWAPSIIPNGEKFDLFYTSKGPIPHSGGRESMRICRAVGDSPLGPFKEVSSAIKDPLINIGLATIDIEGFVDDDGRRYIYYVLDYLDVGKSRILVAELGDDGRVIGESSFCMEPDLPWEGGNWVEAPSVIKHDGWYIMFYSGNPFFSNKYAVGYAVSRSPRGPWVKPPGNRILGEEIGMPGPGHAGLLKHSDGLYYFPFHALIGENARRATFMVGLELKPTGNQYGYRPVFTDIPTP